VSHTKSERAANVKNCYEQTIQQSSEADEAEELSQAPEDRGQAEEEREDLSASPIYDLRFMIDPPRRLFASVNHKS
jgi:hypothetical protein